MPHSKGRKSNTRSQFSKAFRAHGEPSLSKYLTTFKIGDFVDIKVDNSIHKGQPYKFYHGRTGIVYDVTKSAVGVEFSKILKHRRETKRMHIRIEHVNPSRSRDDFIERVKRNEELKKKARTEKIKIGSLKRQNKQPKTGFVVKVTDENSPQTIRPVPFEYTL